ncbi:RNA polymerase sigma factor [Xanthocytophaga agilis]|uniref:RNA polymerase sigma factor n=1 Tax=Xanthocytophaga agilis TaxID=3048010 RepID=A0AAE3R1R6_9BACT|nr:RNA polymerase sigma factor [Xanthocytophaga agilis]MDJ1499298.1 RNA polymerase sigma factor [Xanthocytophaga agilis]
MEAQVFYDIHQPIIERCRLGDRKAQYEVYKLYSKAMFNVAIRITNNYAEAEDALQEAFLNAFQHITNFKGDSTFGSWLKKIVINQALAVLRKRRVQWSSIEEHDFEETNDSEDEEEMNFQIDTIRNAIQLLPEGYRVVLSLYLLEGYDHQEIAEILNISESTSKSQYSRAKQKLMQLIKK